MRRFVQGEDFRLVAACFSRAEAARLLGVSAKTFSRWYDGAKVPWAAYQLLYQFSKYGQGERDAQEAFERYAIIGERDALRARVAQLEKALAAQSRLVDWGCANDPFVDPADPRSKPLVDTTHVML